MDSVPFSNETTSLKAAEAVRDSGSAMTQRQRVLVALHATPDGATHEELSWALGIGIRQVSTRVRSLVLAGLARDSGRTRNSLAGHPNIVWVAHNGGPPEAKKQTHGRIAASVARENEACAMVAERFGDHACAAAIRGRRDPR